MSESADKPECPDCETNEHVIEAPEAGYWYCTACGNPGSGTTEPIWWKNNPESTWYEGDAPDTADHGEVGR